MAARLLLLITVASSLIGYLGLRLSPGLGWPVWAGVTVLLSVVLLYPLSWRRKGVFSSDAFRNLSHFGMGVVSFLFSLVVARDIALLPFTWWKPEWIEPLFGRNSSLTVLAATMALVIFGTYWARSGPRVREVNVPIDGLPPELDGFRIAQISDLHVGPAIDRPYVERVVKMVNQLEPDATVLTGDIADGHHEAHREDVSPLGRLKPLDRLFYVPGNHEYYFGGPQWIEEFQAQGMKALLNSNVVFEHRGKKIMMAGVLDPAARIASPQAKPDAKAALATSQNTHAPDLKILLSHHPGIAREANELGYDLQLSGHTHGGQFFPWTLVIGRVHEFHKGLERVGRMWIYVNPGTGSWGPQIRLGTTPEITLLSLRRA